MSRSATQITEPVEQVFQYSLLGLLASGYLALAGSGSLDLPTVVFTGAGLLLRLLLISRLVRIHVSGRTIAAATLAYIGFYPLDTLYLSREFIPATVHLICFLAVVRILTASSNRDYFFVKLIAFLELLAATLLSASVGFFLYLTLFLIFGVANFCCSEMRRSSQEAAQIAAGPPLFQYRLAALTAGVTFGIVLMTCGLFFLLPRTARAAFRSIVSERYHLPGFSNEVTLGQIGELQQQSTPVMHVRLQPPYEQLSLKWRGAALSRFDGKRWFNPPGDELPIRLTPKQTVLAGDEQRRRHGIRISYQVRIGPVDSDTLFFAGTPEFLNINGLRRVLRGPGDTYRTGLGSSEGREYEAVGHFPETALEGNNDIPVLSPDSFNRHLLLPANTDLRIFELSRQAARGGTALERARSIERHLRTNFTYTTELPLETHEDPLAYFLFDRRRGHCEYFASSMAVMLRAVHIPSRVVTGFQSGTFNRMTGWQVIRASDAHSWVEGYIPGRGWMTFDPTPPDLNRSKAAALWAQLLLGLDTTETLWRDWIVNYSRDRQIDLVSRVEDRGLLLPNSFSFDGRLLRWASKASSRLKPFVIYGGVLFSLAGALWAFGPGLLHSLRARRHFARVSRGQAVASDGAILYGRMLRILHRRGLEKPAWLTPMEFARIVPAARNGVLVEQITAAYQELRYGGDAEAGVRMVRLLEELRSTR